MVTRPGYIKIGLFMNTWAKNLVKTLAIDYGLIINVTDEPGWLGGTMYFTLTGDADRIEQYRKRLIEIAKEYNNEQTNS